MLGIDEFALRKGHLHATVLVDIETRRAVDLLPATGRPPRTGKHHVFAINPMAAARYRDRHAVSGKKSDPGDALALANILRTDMHAHRSLPADSDLTRADLHVHPDGEPGNGSSVPGPDITFHAVAPISGPYRLCLDFKHGDLVRTAEFTAVATG